MICPLSRAGCAMTIHPEHYGVFVRDPHGINLEAVCHRAGA
jgi:hypothetical protein